MVQCTGSSRSVQVICNSSAAGEHLTTLVALFGQPPTPFGPLTVTVCASPMAVHYFTWVSAFVLIPVGWWMALGGVQTPSTAG